MVVVETVALPFGNCKLVLKVMNDKGGRNERLICKIIIIYIFAAKREGVEYITTIFNISKMDIPKTHTHLSRYRTLPPLPFFRNLNNICK